MKLLHNNLMNATKIIKKRPLVNPITLSHNPLLNRIYQAREVSSPEQLIYSLSSLHDPQLLANIQQAVELLYQAYRHQSHIMIVGDFDTDGATSTALAILALKQLGFENINYLIPDRFSQGYGLSIAVAEAVLTQKVDLVLTVDNGVSSLEGIDLLKSHHIQILVTDHHLPSEQLPCADAIINPNLTACHFPSKSLAGVGVIFYVMLALRRYFREQGAFQHTKEPNFAELLDLVALGTVADLVPLDYNNRILVHHGLKRIRAQRCRVGIQALAEVAKRDITRLRSSDLSFAIAPRLNAAGRLENMSLGVELLLCEETSEARKLALALNDLNQSRKQFEEEMKTEALAICATLPQLMQNTQPHGIVLYQSDWHQGILGIIAARIKAQFHRPVIVFAQEQENSAYLKGSARSIDGVHIRDLLEKIDRQHPNLIAKFGGHSMAAGLTIHQNNLPSFQRIFDQEINAWISPEQLHGIIYTDGELSTDEINIETAEQLQQASPWGQHFPEPLFEGNFYIHQQKLVGEKHLKMLVEFNHILYDAIAFNIDVRVYPDLSIKMAKLVYKLDINEFKGNKTIQLLVDEIIPDSEGINPR